ncbi:MAG: cobaltochelatase subunit CobN [Ancalomicrobiaceae bacterium]|nr:cobaltochelatase subunit CobN [Ancalomicrobiaceae bacterium]
MHLLVADHRSLDEAEVAEDLGQSAADVVFLSFSDSDLAAFARAYRSLGEAAPSLRLANLNRLKHPYSVDLYLDRVARHARIIVVRLLGGLDYWRYGTDELAALGRRPGGPRIAIVAGDARADARLSEASSLAADDLDRLWRWFQHGGGENMASAAVFVAGQAGMARPLPWVEPQPIGAFGRLVSSCRSDRGANAARGLQAGGDRPLALVLIYRSIVAADDTAPFPLLADALLERGMAVETHYVTSLKDGNVINELSAFLHLARPDVILNTTAFSARLDNGGSVLDLADAPVIQAMLSTSSREAWLASNRGASAADLAMNVVLPEIDGRIISTAISFKARLAPDPDFEFSAEVHAPDAAQVSHVADLAAAWVQLRAKPRASRRLAAILSNYPAKAGRTGYAVGLDTAASVRAIAKVLADAGYTVGGLPEDIIAALEDRSGVAARVTARLGLPEYRELFAALSKTFRDSVVAAHGAPEADDAVEGGAFALPILRAGRLIVALQPDRGAAAARKSDSHDTNRPPRHAYVAFYLWLRHVEAIDALIHVGTHGTLEWLPGKTVALDAASAPRAVLGPVPIVYPFIVNNPGEAAQAKRRIGAVTLGHLTPPLIEAGLSGEVAEIEALLDEYAQAQTLDRRRAEMIAPAIVDKARASGLAEEIGLRSEMSEGEALRLIDARLCDIKEMRIGDGLHIFGRAPEGEAARANAAFLAEAAGTTPDLAAGLIRASAEAERAGLIAALDGRFVPPGPAGAPSRGRLDVLPTGRNLHAIDPRAVPSPTAAEIGRRSASEVMRRHAQDHGDWPRAIVVDLWGSATMRTGGDDLAQALALMGVRPEWERATGRVVGFEILPEARLEFPRIDVTLRISGLFRDVFPSQIALFDQAAAAVARLEEPDDVNFLAALRRATGTVGPRIFGAAPGGHGAGDLTRRLLVEEDVTRADLGEAYLASTSHAFSAEGAVPSDDFRDRVAGAEAYVHGQDLADTDILAGNAFLDYEGGFAAAAASLGADPALYHLDATRPDKLVVRRLKDEVARALRGRAANPRWILGQMRHGHRGAAEIAEAVEAALGFAVAADAVTSRQFDLLFDATAGDDAVRQFLIAANPLAAGAIARAFERAATRGLWVSRRNSTAQALAEMGREAAP